MEVYALVLLLLFNLFPKTFHYDGFWKKSSFQFGGTKKLSRDSLGQDESRVLGPSVSGLVSPFSFSVSSFSLPLFSLPSLRP